MKKIFAVARWEFIEKVKTKAFFISLITTPIILIGFTLGGTLLSRQDEDYTKVTGFADTSGIYFSPMKNKIEEFKLKDGQPNYLLINFTRKSHSASGLKRIGDSEVLKGTVEGYIFISYGGTDSVNVEYRTKSAGNFKDIERIKRIFNEVKINLELEKRGVDPEVIKNISDQANFEIIKINEKGDAGKSNFLVTFFSSIIFILLLMSMVLYSGGMLIRSLVEEKSNRLIDIIISSCTPNELLTGKIFGLSSLGMFQIFIWVLFGVALSRFAFLPAEAFDNVLPILVYFILGYIFYTSIFVGIGSIVSTEQEAQQFTGYLSLILVFPVILAFPAIQNPDTMLVKVFSYLPLTLPTIMMLRLNLAPVPVYEMILTILIMVLSIFFTVIISAKIFRIGILSYGKMPSLKELIRWIKEK